MDIKRIYFVLGSVFIGLVLSAATIDDAKRLYRDGNYSAAIEKLRTILKTKPKDGTANYYLGASLMALGEVEQAREPLLKAEDRGVADASRLLAVSALDEYRTDDASSHLDAWEAALKKAKKSLPDEFESLQSRMVMMDNMLQRVEKIEIIDSIDVDASEFFNAYRLSAAAGRILPPDAVRHVGASQGSEELSLAYIPQNNSEIMWSASDSTGVFRLYRADILDDGTLGHTVPLDESLAGGGNAKYPFLMPDGVTLYFAGDGDNTLGGYDIFMTRRNENEDGAFFQPQNMGMPYNSPYNDFMLAIDEASGLGWFATDRNQIPGKVTIYVFAPSAMRVNADSTDPNLASLAKLNNISLTRKSDVDYKQLLESKLPKETETQGLGNHPSLFALDMGGGKIYTALAHFQNRQARSAMLEAMATKVALDKHLTEEESLREQYRKGNREVSAKIIESEQETAALRNRYASQVNNAVRLEKGK